MPAKGMTLPFISYGGSSMISLAYGMGMLLALTRERPRAELLAADESSCRAPGLIRRPAGVDRARRSAEPCRQRNSSARRAARRRRHRRPSVSGRSAGRRARPARHRRRSRHRRPRRALRQDISGAAHSHRHQRDRARPRSDIAGAHRGAARRSARCRPGVCSAASQPSAVVGFGGYPTVPPVLAATLRRIPTLIHEQNAVMGRANRLLAGRVTAIATSFAGVLDREPGTRRQGDAHRQSGAAGGDRGGRDALCGSATRRPAPSRRVRRQPGRAHHGRHRAGRDRAARSASADAASVVQQAREEDVAPGHATSMRGLKVAAEVAPFFTDLPARIAAGHLVSRAPAPRPWPNWRRSAGRRSWCRCRMRSTRTSPPMPACWRRPGGGDAPAPGRLHARPAGGRDQRACQRAGKTRSNGRGRHARRARSTPPSGWPIAGRCVSQGDPHRRIAGRARDETAERHRSDPLRRHRRHRHERHRRGADQSRLHRAGLGRVRQRQRQAAARQGRQDLRSATPPTTLGDAEVVVVSTAIKRDNPGTRRPRAPSACRWCAAPRCWRS